MDLVKENDPILKTPCEPFDFINPPFDSIEFSKELVKFMRDADGIGLAANQVGVSYRIFAMRSDPNRVLFNPNIVWFSDEQIVLEEGCLSYPGLMIKVRRPRHVRVRYRQPNGETFTELFTGLAARVVQHEVDHLDGILFFNRANRYHREQAFKKRDKMLKWGTAYAMARELPQFSPTATPQYQASDSLRHIIPPITTNKGLRGDV